MDSEHRHELKTNELASWIDHAPEYLKKNYLQVIGIAIILIAIVFSGPVRRRIANSKLAAYAETSSTIRKTERSKFEAIQTKTESPLILASNELEIASQTTKNQSLAALALIKRAEAIRASLHYAPTDPSAEAVTAELTQAKTAYELAITKAAGNNTLLAKAQFGLGLCAEEAGQFGTAYDIYSKIVASEEFASTVFPVQAQNRLDGMEDTKETFTFVDAPAPAVEDAPAFEMPKPVIPSPAVEVVPTPAAE
jgi:hypothetical protein